MYAYFIRASDQAHYEKKIAQIRSALKKRRVVGEFYTYHSREELKNFVDKNTSLGVKTFVAIGSKGTLYALINAFELDNATQMVFGYIPLKQDRDFDNLFGVASEHDAIDALSQRKIAEITPLLCTRYIILSDFVLKNPDTHEASTLIVDRSLKLTFTAHELRITNKQFEQHSSQPFEIAAFRNPHQSTQSEENMIQLPQKLKTKIPHPLFQTDQVLHLSARRAQIVFPAPYKSDPLDASIAKLLITVAAKPISIITKKHSELK